MRSFSEMPDALVVQAWEEFLFDRSKPAEPAQEPPRGDGGRKSNKKKKTTTQQSGATKPRNVKELSDLLSLRWRAAGFEWFITREEFYFVLAEGWLRNMIALTPPYDYQLREKVCLAYGVSASHKERIRVVASESPIPDYVAREAAQVIVDLMVELRRTKKRVHLGLGAGWTTRTVATQLAALLRKRRDEVPEITFHAISTGFAVDHAATSPVSFFGFFQSVMPRLESVGLFGPPFVDNKDYGATMKQAGVAEAVKRRDEIDIVVTSLASAADEHGDLRKHVGRDSEQTLQALDHQRWLGDVQHQPFNAEGPIVQQAGNRAVTLFELSELVALAKQPGKAVVLVSPPCFRCRKTRARALVPLLRNPKLELWSHLVTDLPTARELVNLAQDPEAPHEYALESSLGGLDSGQ